jgi:hypothetical protein
MIQQLELKHWCAYLPHGLKVLNTKSGRVIEISGIQQLEDTICLIGKNGVTYRLDVWPWPLKPILRPLSDLTKEDWLNVFRAAIDWGLPEYLNVFIDKDVVLIHVGISDYIEIGDGSDFLPDDKDWICSYAFESQQFEAYHSKRINQRIAFDELFKLHADIDHLIKSGLAISINDIK